MIIKNFHAKVDLNQSQYLQKMHQAIIKPQNDYKKNSKLIIIQDQQNQIEQEIDVVEENQLFNKDQVYTHIYFIKFFALQGRRMNVEKEIIYQSINFKTENQEKFIFRNNLFEFIKENQYFCRKKNRIIRKFKLSCTNHDYIYIDYLQKSTAICIKYSKNLVIIYYNLASGKAINIQQIVSKSHKNCIKISKNEKFICTSDQLINIKSSEILTQFYSTKVQFSDCSNYFCYMNEDSITVFDISKKLIYYILQTLFLFNNNEFWENKYRQIQIDFERKKIIVEDYKYQVIIEYYYQL